MSGQIYPSTTSELDRKRRKLSVETATAFQDFSHKVFADGVVGEDQADYSRCGSARDPVPVLHQRTHKGCATAWRYR